ncbi:glutathione synthase [bacterium]|nr:glutathione synthase [bacterium]
MASSKPLRVAVQMDPIESARPLTDTSLMMIEEAQTRGMSVYTYGPHQLVYDAGEIWATARPAKVDTSRTPHVEQGEATRLDLRADVDVVLMRQDPPFDMAYLTAAHLLSFLVADTLVVNDPLGVGSSPEKVFPLMFPDLQPPTLVSRDPEAFHEFRRRHSEIVIKPLYGHGGAGVLRVKPDDGNFPAFLELFSGAGREPFIGQAFLPAIAEGDKRIILVDGDPVGAINRRPQQGGIRSNMAVGGAAEATELSAAEIEICRRIAPELKRRGLLFVGIDVIGGRMTEINVTSPTGARAIKRLTGADPVARMWDAVEARLAGRS